MINSTSVRSSLFLALGVVVGLSDPALSQTSNCPVPGTNDLSGHDLEIAGERRAGSRGTAGFGGQDIELTEGRGAPTADFGGQDIEVAEEERRGGATTSAVKILALPEDEEMSRTMTAMNGRSTQP